MGPSDENEGMPGRMGVANVLAAAVQGNWHYSWSTISLAEILSSHCLSNRKGSAVRDRKQSSLVQQICCMSPKKRQLFVMGIRAVDM